MAKSWLWAPAAPAAGKFFLALFFLTLFACGPETKSKESPPLVISPPPRGASVSLSTAQLPDGRGGYFPLGSGDFINGYYAQDITATLPPKGFDVSGEEATAASSGIFLTAPGLLWTVDPPSPLTVTLTAQGNTQTIKREVGQSGRLAVSFLSFPDVFPPAFRVRYDVTIASVPGATNPFSFTYSFNARRSDAASVFARLLPGDSASKIVLGQETANFSLGAIVTNDGGCSDCVITVDGVSVTAAVKTFVELPAMPVPGNLRISFPRRFSALLVRQVSTSLKPDVSGNASQKVTLSVTLPASVSTVAPWCAARVSPAAACSVTRQGQATPSYFKFVNAVPYDAGEQSLGGTSGVALLVVTGSADVTITRAGAVVEKSRVSLSGASVSPLDSPVLPNWALDDLRNALTTGAPQFSY